MDKFKKVPVEEDTKIKRSHVTQVGGLEALHQKWVWEGIIAESLIFLASDVKELSDNVLLEIVGESGIMKNDSKSTITRNSSGYTFVNFNFETTL